MRTSTASRITVEVRVALERLQALSLEVSEELVLISSGTPDR